MSDFINWCWSNYWWFVLGNFILMFGLPLLLGLFTKNKEGISQFGQYPGCIIVLGFFQCLLGPVLYVFVALGLIIMIVGYLSDSVKKLMKNGRE